MTQEITNFDDTIDSRDIINRLQELKENEEREDWENDELKVLQDLNDQGQNYSSDWPYGVVLIRDSYFVNYAEELAEDFGAINDDNKWPVTHIDWDSAAKELKTDFCCIDFDGVDYWVR